MKRGFATYSEIGDRDIIGITRGDGVLLTQSGTGEVSSSSDGDEALCIEISIDIR